MKIPSIDAGSNNVDSRNGAQSAEVFHCSADKQSLLFPFTLKHGNELTLFSHFLFIYVFICEKGL